MLRYFWTELKIYWDWSDIQDLEFVLTDLAIPIYWPLLLDAVLLLDRVEDLLVRIEKIFADPETGHPSKSLGLLGEKALDNRLNRLEDQVCMVIAVFNVTICFCV